MSGSSGSGEDEKFTTTDNGHILIRRAHWVFDSDGPIKVESSSINVNVTSHVELINEIPVQSYT